MDLYSAFQQVICNLTLSGYSKKSPSVYKKSDTDVEDYLDALSNLLESGGRKYHTKKWWSCDLVEMIYPLHLACTNEFGGGNKVLAGWRGKVLNTRASLRWIKKIFWRNWLRNGT